MDTVPAPGQPSAHPSATVTSRVERKRGLSPIWLIPFVTALIAGYLVWHEYSKRGPTITITFNAADGLTAGQSQLRYRDVTIGTVEAITLAPDLQRVTLTVQTTRAAEPLLTEHARFWVVKPRLFAGSISGLDTLLSGSYLQVSPTQPGGAPRRDFAGLEEPPLLTSNEPGRTFRLQAERIGSINVGSPVFYRDLEVGQVLGWDLADMAEYVTLHTFIRAPFDRYVRENTRFWNASGVSVKLGPEGVQLQFESLRALLLGGIAFETPEGRLTGPAVAGDTVFELFDTRQAADDATFTRRIPVVSYFTDSVSGLARGAPVVFQGIRIGQVVDYELRYDAATDRLRIPVRYEIEPQRIALSDETSDRGPLDNARRLVQQGLRARLVSANLLTGAQQISLDIVADAPPAEIAMDGDALVFPTAPSQFASILDSVNAVLARVESLPLQQIGDNLNSTIAGVNDLVRAPELAASIAALQATLQTAEATMRSVDASLTPALRTLPQLVANLNGTVTQANRLIVSANRGYGDESQFRRDLDRMLEQITVAARSLRSLSDTLNRNPESLLRGRATQGQ
jgi:paraquat-inducible protein B